MSDEERREAEVEGWADPVLNQAYDAIVAGTEYAKSLLEKIDRLHRERDEARAAMKGLVGELEDEGYRGWAHQLREKYAWLRDQE